MWNWFLVTQKLGTAGINSPIKRHRLAGGIKKNKNLQYATEKIFTSGQKTHTLKVRDGRRCFVQLEMTKATSSNTHIKQPVVSCVTLSQRPSLSEHPVSWSTQPGKELHLTPSFGEATGYCVYWEQVGLAGKQWPHAGLHLCAGPQWTLLSLPPLQPCSRTPDV